MVKNGALEIQEFHKSGKWILKIRGPLIKDTVQEFNTVVEPYFKKLGPVVIDLSDISFFDTFGVSTLVEKYQWSRIMEQDFSFKGMKPEIQDILKLEGLDHFLCLDKA